MGASIWDWSICSRDQKRFCEWQKILITVKEAKVSSRLRPPSSVAPTSQSKGGKRSEQSEDSPKVIPHTVAQLRNPHFEHPPLMRLLNKLNLALLLLIRRPLHQAINEAMHLRLPLRTQCCPPTTTSFALLLVPALDRPGVPPAAAPAADLQLQNDLLCSLPICTPSPDWSDPLARREDIEDGEQELDEQLTAGEVAWAFLGEEEGSEGEEGGRGEGGEGVPAGLFVGWEEGVSRKEGRAGAWRGRYDVRR